MKRENKSLLRVPFWLMLDLANPYVGPSRPRRIHHPLHSTRSTILAKKARTRTTWRTPKAQIAAKMTWKKRRSLVEVVLAEVVAEAQEFGVPNLLSTQKRQQRLSATTSFGKKGWVKKSTQDSQISD